MGLTMVLQQFLQSVKQKEVFRIRSRLKRLSKRAKRVSFIFVYLTQVKPDSTLKSHFSKKAGIENFNWIPEDNKTQEQKVFLKINVNIFI